MKPLYKFSFSEAKRNGETEECRESFRENIRCRDFLDKEITESMTALLFAVTVGTITKIKLGEVLSNFSVSITECRIKRLCWS